MFDPFDASQCDVAHTEMRLCHIVMGKTISQATKKRKYCFNSCIIDSLMSPTPPGGTQRPLCNQFTDLELVDPSFHHHLMNVNPVFTCLFYS